MVQGKNQWVKPLANAVSLGTSIAAAIAFPIWVGNKLDERFGTGMLWMLVGLFLGMLTCGKMVWDRLVKSGERKEAPVYTRVAESSSARRSDRERGDPEAAEEEDDGGRSSWW